MKFSSLSRIAAASLASGAIHSRADEAQLASGGHIGSLTESQIANIRNQPGAIVHEIDGATPDER
jgi:hypothetical protein